MQDFFAETPKYNLTKNVFSKRMRLLLYFFETSRKLSILFLETYLKLDRQHVFLIYWLRWLFFRLFEDQ